MATKGVIIEFDLAAMNGAELLFNVMRDLLNNLEGVDIDLPMEDRFLVGGNYQGGMAELLREIKSKKTAQKTARDLAAAFKAALNEAVPSAVTPAFRNFVKALTDKGVKVVIATRADLDAVSAAFEPVLGDNVVLYHEESNCYGTVKWDSWRRACAANELSYLSTIAVTGSGRGVKSALLAGMGSFAVINPHVAHQDFGGADDVVEKLTGTTAKMLLAVLRV